MGLSCEANETREVRVEPLCCGAQIRLPAEKRKRHSLASRYSVTAEVLNLAAKR